MDAEHGAGPRADRRRGPARIQVERARVDIDEYGDRAAQCDGVGGRGEGPRGHHHFVARFEAEQKRGHLQRVGAGRREERRAAGSLPKEQFVTGRREGAAADERSGREGAG